MSTKQVKASIEQPFKPLTSTERATLRDYLSYVRESISDVVKHEETYGNRAPILSTLREYARGASALLERLR